MSLSSPLWYSAMPPLTHEEYLAEVKASRERAAKRLELAKAAFDAETRAIQGRRGRLPQYGRKGKARPKGNSEQDPRPLLKAPSKPARRSMHRVVGRRTVDTLARPGDVLAKCHPEYPHYALGLCRRCYSKENHQRKKATK